MGEDPLKVFAERLRYAEDSTSIFVPFKKGDLQEVRELEYRTCCGEMAEAWDRGIIGFGEKDKFLNKVERVCIYECSPYPEGAVWDETPISHCPFCGVRIDIEILG